MGPGTNMYARSSQPRVCKSCNCSPCQCERAESARISSLGKDVLSQLLLKFCVTSPRSKTVCGSVCKSWRDIVKAWRAVDAWKGFKSCLEACERLNARLEGPRLKEGLLKVFVWAREGLALADCPISVEAIDANRKTRESAAKWFVTPRAHENTEDDTDLGADWHLHENSIQLKAIQGAFEWWNKTHENQNTQTDDDEAADDHVQFDVPFHHTMFSVVPRGGGNINLQRLVCATAIERETAYGGHRDQEWPVERCALWLDDRLQEIDATWEEVEVYTSGDYWHNLHDGADGREHSGSGSGSFFQSDMACGTGCVLLTRHCVMVIATADDD